MSRLLVTFAWALSLLLLVPLPASGNDDVFLLRSDADFAVALFSHEVGVCSIDVSVEGIREIQRELAQPPKEVSFANVAISQTCNGAPVLVAVGSAQGVSFEVARRFQEARLTATIEGVCDNAVTFDCFTVVVDVAWEGTGAISADHDRFSFVSPGVEFFTRLARPGTATGTVFATLEGSGETPLPTANLIPFPSDEAFIGNSTLLGVGPEQGPLSPPASPPASPPVSPPTSPPMSPPISQQLVAALGTPGGGLAVGAGFLLLLGALSRTFYGSLTPDSVSRSHLKRERAWLRLVRGFGAKHVSGRLMRRDG